VSKVLCAFAMTQVTAYLPSANKAIRDGCPDRLHVVATLFGLSAAPPEKSRVLEIGCAEGVHLAALAVLAPGSRHLGVDLDERAVAKGTETISTLGLDNLSLECTDFRELARRSERYDYVIAHGVYSWVPRQVRDALLSVVRDLLDERGVAYVSFNALPGSHARNMVRDLVLPHVHGLTDSRERIQRAREVAKELLRLPTQPGSAFALLRAELEHFSRASESLVHHDYLAETNESVTVTTFVEHLEEHGLEYIADAGTLDCSPLAGHPLASTLDAGTEGRLERLAQLDRLEMRRFRQAVVCRKGASSRNLDFARASSLWFTSSAEPAARGAMQGTEPVRFKCVSGLELETTVPSIKFALYELGRVWPAALRLDDLAQRAAEHLGSTLNPEELSRLLLDSAASVAVRAFARAPRAARTLPSKPAATALARLEATTGSEVTNLHHEPVKIEVAFHRALLALLDGTRSHDALSHALADAIEARHLAVPGIEPGARSRWEGLLGREVEAGLNRLARYALLVT
jgi:methyltransferase-like protein/SAM-dependent methyltransferase